MHLFDLSGKVAVITGASSGLGSYAVKAYVEHGASVALIARRKDRIDTIARELIDAGHQAIAIQCDVTDEASVKKAVGEIISYYGRIDILLNNAGIAVRGTVEELSIEDWDRSMDVNVKGMFLMSKYIIPHMRERQYGKIVNIASVNAILADKGYELARHVYNASKASVRGLTMGMAATYMADNITVNSIGPGLFETEMTKNSLFKHEGFMQMYINTCPASRAAKQDELNGTIIYLSSDASSYVTSQHIIVDGGTSIV